MKPDIIRAWKDEFYRQSLGEEQRCALPAHPAGELELADDQLESIYGGGPHHESVHAHSMTLVICDVNIVSLNIRLNLLNVVSTSANVCNQDD